MNIQEQVFYSGVVENRRDPLFLGRCQVRVVGLHTEDKAELPTDALPWAYPLQPITSAAMNGIGYAPVGPVEGTWVMVIFRDADKQQPIIIGTLGGIPQADNNASIERDEDGYLINSDNYEPMYNSSGVPILNQNGTALIAGLPGGYVGGQGGLALSLAELEAGLSGQGVNVTRLDKNVIAGSLSSVSSTSGAAYYPNARTLGSNSPYNESYAALNRVASTLGNFQSVPTAQLNAFLNTLEQANRITGTLVGSNAQSQVGVQIQNQITGFARSSNQFTSAASNLQSGIGQLQSTISSVNVSFGTLQGSVTNLGNSFNQLGAAFNNPGFQSIGLGGIGSGLNKVAGSVGRVVGTVQQGVQQVVGVVQTGAAIANQAATFVNNSAALGSALNNKFNLGIGSEGGQVALGALATIALNNPKVAAVVNAVVRTKAAIDTINRVVGKYTGGAVGSIVAGRLFTPLIPTETRLINAGALITGIASKQESNFTPAGAKFSAAIGSIQSEVAKATNAITDVANKINEVASTVSEVAGDVATVVNAVGDAAGAWGAVGTAFGGKKGGSKQTITFQQTGSILGDVQLIGGAVRVGVLQENDLDAFRDGIAFYKTASVPGSVQNFNVNGVVGGQNYGVISPLGQLGKYQLNSEQLTEAGYVRFLTNIKGERVYPSNFRLARNDVWTGKNGINSVQRFIATPEVQELAMLEVTAINYQELVRQELITEKTSPEEITGYLSIAHNKGLSAVRQFIDGINVQDITGSTGFQDFAVGFSSLSGKEAVVVPGNAPSENRDTTIPPIGERDANGNLSFGRKIVGDEGLGFRDPEKKYPLQDKVNEPDTNRLARNQFIGKTIVTLKEANKDKKVIIAGTGQTWDQPDSPYDAVYPFNHTYESESGHVVEIDDTPNRERMQWYHRKGTFEEWDPNGTCVRRIVGDSYEIVDRNGFVHVRGNCNITVDGNANLMVRSNATVEVLGNTTGYFRNDVNMEVSGEMNWSVREDFNLKAANITFETTGTPRSLVAGAVQSALGVGSGPTDGFLKFVIRGPVNMAAENDINIVAKNNLLIQALDNLGISSSNNFNVTAGENFDLSTLTGGIYMTTYSPNPVTSAIQLKTLNPAGRVSIEAGLSMNILARTGVLTLNAAGGQINLRTPSVIAADAGFGIFLNSGLSGFALPAELALPVTTPRGSLPLIPSLPDLIPKRIAGVPTGAGTYTQLPSPSVRGTPVNPNLDILTLPPRGISTDQFFETPEEGDSTQFRSNQIQRGRLSPNVVPTERESSESIPATPKQGKMPVGCDTFAKMTEFPISTRLSANFYLGDFLTPTPGGTNAYICVATTPQRLVDGPDGSKAEIMCNLKGFAENIMERIITVVPKSEILVTSGYRARGSIGAIESTNSDHPRGCAVDIVLRNFGGNRRKHYELALELQRILPYDQLFLEYTGTVNRGSVWIHIGYRAFQSSQRGIVGTIVGHSFNRPPSEIGKLKLIN
jgi:hypothetical protein